MMKKKFWITISMAVVLFALLGCAAAKSEEMIVSEEAFDDSVRYGLDAPAIAVNFSGESDVYPQEKPIDDAGFSSDGTEAQQERIVLKNANITIKVEDPAEVINRIAFLAERRGGFVVSSSTYQSYYYDAEKQLTQGYIQVRVPAEDLNAALDEIRGYTTEPKFDVSSENISGQDVTSEYTNLESRLRNLEDAEEQLRGFLEDAEDTEAVLQVYNQLKGVNEEIEIIKGQLKYYSESAAMSSIYVEVLPKYKVTEIQIGGWNPQGVAKQAIQRLINASQTIVNAFIWIVLFVLPVLILLALPVVIFVVILRALIRRRKKVKNAQPPKADEV